MIHVLLRGSVWNCAGAHVFRCSFAALLGLSALLSVQNGVEDIRSKAMLVQAQKRQPAKDLQFPQIMMNLNFKSTMTIIAIEHIALSARRRLSSAQTACPR